MKNSQAKVLVGVVALLLLTALLTSFRKEAVFTGYTILRTDDLPDQVGDYRGENVLFCQNEQCMSVYVVATLTNTTTCPRCGGALNRLSPGERTVLPPETRILKKRYVSPSGREIPVTVVFSGQDQRSIHRPQRCLPGQGYVIEKTRTLAVPIPGRSPLNVAILTARSKVGQGNEPIRYLTYVYWYVGGDYETSSHYDRLARTALGRIFRNRLDLWAYVSLSVQHGKGHDPAPVLMEFVARLYPLLRRQ